MFSTSSSCQYMLPTRHSYFKLCSFALLNFDARCPPWSNCAPYAQLDRVHYFMRAACAERPRKRYPPQVLNQEPLQGAPLATLASSPSHPTHPGVLRCGLISLTLLLSPSHVALPANLSLRLDNPRPDRSTAVKSHRSVNRPPSQLSPPFLIDNSITKSLPGHAHSALIPSESPPLI